MIKAVGENVVILGLSDRNIERLTAGDPIRFDGAAIGLYGKTVYILHGKNEQTIAQDLVKAGMVGKDTILR